MFVDKCCSLSKHSKQAPLGSLVLPVVLLSRPVTESSTRGSSCLLPDFPSFSRFSVNEAV